MPVGIEQYGRFFRRFEFRLVDVTNGFLSDIVIQFFKIGIRDRYGTMEAYGLLEFVRDELFELFDENDVRRSLYFNPENKAIRKFKDLPNSYGVLHFFPVSEMYLIEAESYARNGQEGEARQALEEFQRHRIRNYQGYKGADLLQEIMNERRREFCLEYDMRWCDPVSYTHLDVYKRQQSDGAPLYLFFGNINPDCFSPSEYAVI